MTPRVLAFCAVVLLLAGTVVAADPDIVVVRATSLDAVAADVDRLGAALGTATDGSSLLDMALGALGITDSAWIDHKRPLVAVLPMQGLVVGAQGIVAAFPVRDGAAAREALAALFDAAVDGEDGLVELTREGAAPMFARIEPDLVVLGANRFVLAAFDPRAALAGADLPPGNLVADVFLEPIAPMAEAGLATAQQMLQQQMEQQPQPEPDGEGDAETTPGLDPAAMQPVFDLYFDAVRDLLHNASRIQIGFEVAAADVVVHGRAVPRAGTTLAGVVAAQSGGLPEMARLIDPSGSLGVFAGQIRRTPELTAALTSYGTRYTAAMRSVLQAAAASQPERAAEIGALAGVYDDLNAVWLPCYRGDWAGSAAWTENGISFAAVQGVTDRDACRTGMTALLKRLAAALAEVDASHGGEFSENALEYRGVRAMRQTIPLASLAGLDPDPESTALLETWLGDAITTYFGFDDDRLVVAGGPDAEARFRGLVDRIRDGGGAKIGPDDFAPLTTGPGVFASLDLRRLVELAAAAESEEEAAKVRKILGALPERGARVVYGVRFDGSSVRSAMTVPLDLLRAVREAASDAEDGTPVAPGGEVTPAPAPDGAVRSDAAAAAG